MAAGTRPLVAHNISQRRFLPAEEGAWIDELRRELEEIQVRSLECTGGAASRSGELRSAWRNVTVGA
jgi:hypothetical protein